MGSVWQTWWAVVVPLFVAVDPIGLLPLYWALSGGASAAEHRRIVLTAVGTAAMVSLLFLVGAGALFTYLGVAVADFTIAGGVLLFLYAVRDLLPHGPDADKLGSESIPDPGPVPLGVPLIAGPALLTTELLLAQRYGAAWTALGLGVVLVATASLFLGSEVWRRWIGLRGVRILSKLGALVLAAIAVMLIREGIAGWLVLLDRS